MENAQKKKKKSFPRWLTLNLYTNCFGEGNSKHLGICFRGQFFCVTHSPGGGVLIEKKHLKMKTYSEFPEYFKRCLRKPNLLHTTRMKISEGFVVMALLSSELERM